MKMNASQAKQRKDELRRAIVLMSLCHAIAVAVYFAVLVAVSTAEAGLQEQENCKVHRLYISPLFIISYLYLLVSIPGFAIGITASLELLAGDLRQEEGTKARLEEIIFHAIESKNDQFEIVGVCGRRWGALDVKLRARISSDMFEIVQVSLADNSSIVVVMIAQPQLHVPGRAVRKSRPASVRTPSLTHTASPQPAQI